MAVDGLFYPGRNLHCSQTGCAEWKKPDGFTQVVIYIALKLLFQAKKLEASFTQVVIYIALKRVGGWAADGTGFTQVVIYIALKLRRLCTVRQLCFTQVVIYIALKRHSGRLRRRWVLPRS